MANLLAIVSVKEDERVRCCQLGCGKPVFRAIHVVRDGQQLLVLGSTCFAKRYGSATALGGPSYGGSGGRQLTDAERDLLANNTAALIAQFEAEVQDKARMRREALTRKSPPALVAMPTKPNVTALLSSRSSSLPWHWAEPRTSLFYIHLKDGTGWIRVQHNDGYQRLVPWPRFDGWDETLPSSVGLADQELGCFLVKDFVSALRYLKQLSVWDKVFPSWPELKAELSQRLKDLPKP